MALINLLLLSLFIEDICSNSTSSRAKQYRFSNGPLTANLKCRIHRILRYERHTHITSIYLRLRCCISFRILKKSVLPTFWKTLCAERIRCQNYLKTVRKWIRKLNGHTTWISHWHCATNVLQPTKYGHQFWTKKHNVILRFYFGILFRIHIWIALYFEWVPIIKTENKFILKRFYNKLLKMWNKFLV